MTFSAIVVPVTARKCVSSVRRDTPKRVASADTRIGKAKSIVRGKFAAGGVTAVSAKTWFADSYGDYARIDAKSNADGGIAGTFRSASSTDSAFWCGLQILGPGFSPYIPKGATIIIR